MKKLRNTILIISTALVCLACEPTNDILIPEEPVCVEGEFIRFNPHCLGWVDDLTTHLFDIRSLVIRNMIVLQSAIWTYPKNFE